MTTTEDGDVPKIVATVLWSSPRFVFSTGVAYLRMRRLARVSSIRFRASLESSGMPPERARQLSENYGVDLSITKLLSSMGKHAGSDCPREPSGK